MAMKLRCDDGYASPVTSEVIELQCQVGCDEDLGSVGGSSMAGF
jgi:hypothetical protein